MTRRRLQCSQLLVKQVVTMLGYCSPNVKNKFIPIPSRQLFLKTPSFGLFAEIGWGIAGMGQG